jgi:V8-like Glu-specific endopeptidase
MQRMKLLFLLIFPLSALASIFDHDDRLEYYEIQDRVIQKQTESTPALIRKNMLVQLPDGNYRLQGTSLSERFKMCEEAMFAKQSLIANCSSALVGKNKILTAAHCISNNQKDIEKGLEEYFVVFDYKVQGPGLLPSIIAKENVFTLKKSLYYNFDTSMSKTAIDLMVIELDRQVHRPILKVNTQFQYNAETPVYMLGHPLGVPLKLSSNGTILAQKAMPNSFRHDLDAFSVNSGSPVFDLLSNEIIGVHVRGTGPNTSKYEQDCHDWYRADRKKDYDEANTLHVLQGQI